MIPKNITAKDGTRQSVYNTLHRGFGEAYPIEGIYKATVSSIGKCE
jgi:hypothetical protein